MLRDVLAGFYMFFFWRTSVLVLLFYLPLSYQPLSQNFKQEIWVPPVMGLNRFQLEIVVSRHRVKHNSNWKSGKSGKSVQGWNYLNWNRVKQNFLLESGLVQPSSVPEYSESILLGRKEKKKIEKKESERKMGSERKIGNKTERTERRAKRMKNLEGGLSPEMKKPRVSFWEPIFFPATELEEFIGQQNLSREAQ